MKLRNKNEVHALSFALRYAPPTLVMQYYLGEEKSQKYVHCANVFIKKNDTVKDVIERLIEQHPRYFNSSVMPADQLNLLIQKLMDNKGRRMNNLRLKTVDHSNVTEEKPPHSEQLNKEGNINTTLIEEDIIIGEAEGKNPVRLRRVILKDENKEVLIDEQMNIYDMEGNHLGRLKTNV